MNRYTTDGYIRSSERVEYLIGASVGQVALHLKVDVTLSRLTPREADEIEQKMRDRKPFAIVVEDPSEPRRETTNIHALAVEMAKMARDFADDRCAHDSYKRALDVLAILGED